jgi:ribosome biogenesis GTPase / thiamine phosphate phosphatase
VFGQQCKRQGNSAAGDLSGGGLVLDTPGLREVALVGDKRGIDMAFDDVRAFAEGCRFRDCRHRGEPGCPVASAIARGEIGGERVADAASLRDERSRTRRRALEKARGRRIASAIREMKRHKGNGD